MEINQLIERFIEYGFTDIKTSDNTISFNKPTELKIPIRNLDDIDEQIISFIKTSPPSKLFYFIPTIK